MLAIVIPYYKLHFFESTLASLAAQYNQNFNVYIGNDASPEDPWETINRYREKIKIEYKKFEENFGENSLVKQWDRCIEMTKNEEWIMILGDDDVLEPNVVSSFYKHLPHFGTSANVIRYSTRIITEEPYHVSDAFNHPVWESPTAAHFRRATGKTRSSLSEYIFGKSDYERYGFFDFPLAWHSDDRAWLEFSENKPIYSINDACVLIRNSHLNISGRTDNEEQKHQASMAFYRYLLFEQLPNYDKDQRLVIIKLYRNLIKRTRTLNLDDRFNIFISYLRNPSWDLIKSELKLGTRKLLRWRTIFF